MEKTFLSQIFIIILQDGLGSTSVHQSQQVDFLYFTDHVYNNNGVFTVSIS